MNSTLLEKTETVQQITRNVCKASFAQFVKEFWNQVPGAGRCVWNWHLDFICEELQKIAERVFQGLPRENDILINISPGTSKSTLCSILFPCWIWTRMPTARIITASHTDELVLDLATKSRDVILSEKYQACFPEVELSKSQNAKGSYRNTLGGDRRTCTVGGKSPTGFHAHFLLVDDPLDPKKAVSEVEIKNAREFMTQVLPSRKTNKEVSVTVLIMQRLDRQDPTAVLLENAKKPDGPPIRHICLPAELPVGDDGAFLEGNVSPKELVNKYINGLMDHRRLNRKVLREFKSVLGRYGYAGQFEQNPIPLEGGMFKAAWFSQRVRSAPYKAIRVRSWDRAATSAGGCATAGVLIAKDEKGRYYVEDVVVGQWEPNERNDMIYATALKDRLRYGPNNDPLIMIEAERGSAGLESFQGMARRLAGFRVKEDLPTGSKDVRAEPWADQLAAMNVWLVEELDRKGQPTWDINSYIQEHLMFRPDMSSKRLGGGLKDRVDASSGGFNYLAPLGSKTAFRVYSLPMGPSSKKGQLRIVICDHDSIKTTIIEQRALFLLIDEPKSTTDTTPEVVTNRPEIPHAINTLVDYTKLTFADVQPSEKQDCWGEVMTEYNTLPENVIMKAEQGKKLWSFLLKKRDPLPEVIVICGYKRIQQSIALAVADTMHLPRSVIWNADDPEVLLTTDTKPDNTHVFDVVKVTRGMVVS